VEFLQVAVVEVLVLILRLEEVEELVVVEMEEIFLMVLELQALQIQAAVVVERLVYFLVKGQVPMVEQADQE
tara:strand:- start:308 stop:523 length:216 start_codon:yes stop_codon:yes gene_type:complete